MKNFLNMLEIDSSNKNKKEVPKYKVLFQDDNIVVFDKSSGIAVIPERYDIGNSLKELAEFEIGKLLTVHRIDKETSGIVLFAKNAESHRNLNIQFEKRECEKIYIAVLEGELPEDEMKIDIPIGTDPSDPTIMRPSARGKECVTIFKVINRFKGYTLVSANLLTGRQHQIRVHARAIGFPLLVDSIYGNRSNFLLSTLKRGFRTGKYSEESPIISRLTLHAQKLSINHPITNERITFESELPRDLKALIQQLSKLRRIN
ncbi:MAG: RluA family pseudouridine synthase [Chlorobiota bacterium]|nr:RluA family pseudouridine synthase [Chlorobiota bacterium]QQS67517.1 MAG: RluA family pseudouridine synthase [Chlorobiota bacterium]